MPCRKARIYSNPKKATAWRNFSTFIRLRDAIKTTGDIYYCKCITCGEIKPIEKIHAGHAIGGRKNSVLFNEEQVNGQCSDCNCEGNGEKQMYKRIMIETYGQEKWDYWQSTKNDIIQYSDFDFEQISKTYLGKIKELKKG